MGSKDFTEPSRTSVLENRYSITRGPIVPCGLSAVLRVHSHLSGGLRLRNYRAVQRETMNLPRSLRFSRVFVAVTAELRG